MRMNVKRNASVAIGVLALAAAMAAAAISHSAAAQDRDKDTDNRTHMATGCLVKGADPNIYSSPMKTGNPG